MSKGKQDHSIAELVKLIAESVEEKGVVYVGPGARFSLGVSSARMFDAVNRVMKEYGYKSALIRTDDISVDGRKRVLKVLLRGDIKYKEVFKNKALICSVKDAKHDLDTQYRIADLIRLRDYILKIRKFVEEKKAGAKIAEHVTSSTSDIGFTWTGTVVPVPEVSDHEIAEALKLTDDQVGAWRQIDPESVTANMKAI